MKKLLYFTLAGIIFVLSTGTLAHFLYEWSGKNQIVGFFTPVNESIWEHMKLLFFPMLIYSLILLSIFRKKSPCITSSLCFGILTGTLLIPVLYYAYTSILGSNVFILDIGIFIFRTIFAFLLSYKLSMSCRLKHYTLPLCALVVILFVCFIIFTYHPPHIALFADPASSHSPAAAFSHRPFHCMG